MMLRSALHRAPVAARATVGDFSDDVRAEVDAVLGPMIRDYARQGADEALARVKERIPEIEETLRPMARNLASDALSSEALQTQLSTAREELKGAFVSSTAVNVIATVLAALFLPPLFQWAKGSR
jgi:membrane-associated HD superfamily phosphohydrolase